MTRRRNWFARPGALLASLALLSGLFSGIPSAISARTGFNVDGETCRASAIKLGGNEPVLANAQEDPCTTETAPTETGAPLTIDSPASGVQGMVEARGPYARTNTPGRRLSGRAPNAAEAGVVEATVSIRQIEGPEGKGINGPGYIYLDGLTSSANSRCSESAPVLSGESEVAQIRNLAGVSESVEAPGEDPSENPGNHRHVAVPGGTIHLNEQILQDTNGDGQYDKITQRGFWLDLALSDVGDVVLAESSAGCSGPAVPIITTAAGSPDPKNPAQLSQAPVGLASNGSKTYITDQENHVVRMFDFATGQESIVAGNRIAGFSGDGGPATQAKLHQPGAVAVDRKGVLYIGDTYADLHHSDRVRMVGTDGKISTLVDDLSQAPAALAVDPNGILHIAISNIATGTTVSKLGPQGILIPVAGGGFQNIDGGSALRANISGVQGITFDSAGNLFISQHRLQPNGIARVQMVNSAGTIVTVAGSNNQGWCEGGDGGPATEAHLCAPSGLAVDAFGNLLIADRGNHRVRSVSAGPDGVVNKGPDETIRSVVGWELGGPGFLGDGGPATGAQLDVPIGLAFDGEGNLVVADTRNRRLRKVMRGADDRLDGSFDETIATIAGTGTRAQPNLGDGGQAVAAHLRLPHEVMVGPGGQLVIADSGNQRIRQVDQAGVITTIAGGGTSLADPVSAAQARILEPGGLALDSGGGVLFSDSASGLVRRLWQGQIKTVAGGGSSLGDSGVPTAAAIQNPRGLTLDQNGNLYIAEANFDGSEEDSSFGRGPGRVRRVSPGPNGVVDGEPEERITTLAGGGNLSGRIGDGAPATTAQLMLPWDVEWFDNAVYIAESGNNLIRKVDSAGTISTVAGHGITKVDSRGAKSTLYGDGNPGFSGDGGSAQEAGLDNPRGLELDAKGNIYVADSSNHRIRMVDLTGRITTIAGGGEAYGEGGRATSSQLNEPRGMALGGGALYVADTGHFRIRKISGLPVYANLVLTNAASPNPVSQGSDLTYTLTAKNNGSDTAMATKVTDTLPQGVTYKSSTPAVACAYASQDRTVTCNLGDIPAGSQGAATITVVPTSLGPLSNTGTVSAQTPDPDTSNNTATATTLVGPSTGPAPGLPTLSISDNLTINEGAGTPFTGAVFNVTLSSPSTEPVTVRYAAADGPSAPGDRAATMKDGDYLPTAGSVLVFEPGQTTKQAAVRIHNDSVVEGDESFSMFLGLPENATLADNQAKGVILDSDD